MARKSTKQEQEQKKVDFSAPVKKPKPTLRDQIREREAATKTEKKEPTVVKMAGGKKKEAKETKNAQMSVKLYEDTYNAFCKINRARGMSNNSVVNMLIAQYVKDNKDLMDD